MSDFTRKPSVLIIDDSHSMRSYVSQLLLRAGYDVYEAEDGCAGLARLEALPGPDVALLDVEMPRMSGLELLQTVGLKPRLYSIILFTTQSSPEQIATGLDLGADDYVIKPFQDRDLLARIRAAVRTARHKRALAHARQETEAALCRLRSTQGRLVEQEKVAAVARLAAGAAHHINNPLGFVMSNLSTLERYAGAILRYADDLARELGALDPARGPEILELQRSHRIRQIRRDLPDLLQETREGGQRIALIIQQLAQLELGLGHQSTTELDLTALLRPLVDMLAVLAPAGSTVTWSAPQQTVAIRGSLALLNTALAALLKNACEALGSQPGTVSVTLQAQPELAEILIADSGGGVLSDHLPSLFDPFFSTKPPESHVGLGLTIAERFISGHGGRIFICSDPRGTCVKIQLPRLPKVDQEQPDCLPAEPRQRA